jgi:hypothetical protein
MGRDGVSQSREMGQMAAIRKKLRETIFFFCHLSNEKNAFDLEAEDVEFFLSAFLTAGCGVIGLFYKDCRSWFLDWKMALVDCDRKFLNDMSRQRNLEVHEGGADLIPQFEPVSITKLEADARHVDSWSGPPSIRPPQVEKKNYYFLIDGKQLEVNSVCKRYLELLMKLMSDFEESGWRGVGS